MSALFRTTLPLKTAIFRKVVLSQRAQSLAASSWTGGRSFPTAAHWKGRQRPGKLYANAAGVVRHQDPSGGLSGNRTPPALQEQLSACLSTRNEILHPAPTRGTGGRKTQAGSITQNESCHAGNIGNERAGTSAGRGAAPPTPSKRVFQS